MNYKMIPLEKGDIKKFKRIMQEAFQKGYEDEFGKYQEMIIVKNKIVFYFSEIDILLKICCSK